MDFPIGSHFIGGFDGTEITPVVRKLIQKYEIGGFILFRRNIESPKQVLKLTRDLQKISKKKLFMGVDQEGGRVFRLGAPFTQVPPMALVGRYVQNTGNLRQVRELGRLLGREVKAVGFNWDFAPVVDVHSNPKNPIIGDRSFGPDPKLVTECAEALIRGLHDVGVLSCAKHFPGHGATAKDSHVDLPVVDDPGRLLWKRDFIPYRKLIAKKIIPALMTAHVVYPDLDEENCATLSPYILRDILRKRLKYKGLIASDDFFMKAIADRMGLVEASLRFFRVGGDVALLCHEPARQIEVLEQVSSAASKDLVLQDQLKQSQKRLVRLHERFLKRGKAIPLSTIGSDAHRKVVEKILEGA